MEEFNPVVIGQLVKQKRIEKNIGVRELARVIGVSAGYITQLEKGSYKNPSQTVLIKLFELLKFKSKYKHVFGLSEISEKEIDEKINSDEIKKIYLANITEQAETMELDDLKSLTIFLESYRDIFLKIIEIDEKAHEKNKVIYSIREFIDFVHNKNVVKRLHKLFE